MKIPQVIVADFETEAIKPRPDYPPRPVSLALQWPEERKPRMLAWGHPSGNTCTEKEARGEWKRARESPYPMLFQNAEFDLEVAERAWGCKIPARDRYHDTKFLLALYDPHAESFSLKPSAERLLRIKPEEQDRMYDWIIENIPEARRKPSTAGAYICKCPYSIVEPYHRGDLTRTLGLFRFLWPEVVDRMDMLAAYDRERRVMPILLDSEQRGMPVDMDALAHDLPIMERGLRTADAWLRKRLGDINMDSDRQLGEALVRTGSLREHRRSEYRRAANGRVIGGQVLVNKKELTIDKFVNPDMYQVLAYRSQMTTSVDTFMRPWLELGARDHGVLHPSIAQVRSSRGGGADVAGARSGRIIYFAPNLTNIPKKWKKAVVAGYKHPSWLRAPELPFMRRYCLPRPGKRWGRRDWNQQEVRLFAHFEEGPVAAGFARDPRFDMHEDVRVEEERALVAAGVRESFDRDSAKGTVFAGFYGQGLDGLMQLLRLPESERHVGKAVQQALRRAAPSIKELSDALAALAKEGLPIRTWGGRLYYCEEPRYVAKYNRDMTFEYKLISYLIQGSGADVAKEALIRWHTDPRRDEELLVTVYDELNIDLPQSTAGAKEQMAVLRQAMESIECDVPMLSDGEAGPNWGSLEKWKEKR